MAPTSSDTKPLLSDPNVGTYQYGGTATGGVVIDDDSLVDGNYDAQEEEDVDEDSDDNFVPIKEKTWSFSHRQPRVSVHDTPLIQQQPQQSIDEKLNNGGGSGCCNKDPSHYIFCVIYAIVNVIVAAPALYGYAAVIFNNPVFNDHMNALSKLLIFSSLVHQLGFLIFSSLPFAIGTVQDAGLIFLSTMANTIADKMQEDGHTDDEILSTTLALLCLGTATLGLVLVAMGYFRLADAVSYLPMPVVGGYLAFIGYFCVQAGTALCISQPMMSIIDWNLLFNPHNLLLAAPGLLAGLVLTMTSRLATNSGVLPLVMVSIPALFYVLLYGCGSSLEDAREMGWVGETSPPVPVSDLLKLVDFRQVQWNLILKIIPTWVGMVFVVSFASCLDVAAISIDMGQPLDTNRELATVGICNFMSGMSFGFTGSYIFSQTIFTYRTGVHDRLIGFLVICMYAYIVASKVNILQVAPLFFLGSTLIFIGYDLMWEWLWEVRHQVFLSEYFIVWFTFISIHVVGINAGIVVGVLFAIVDQIFATAKATGVNRVEKRSRAVYTPSDSKIIHDKAYAAFIPQIVTLELFGNIFFGSSLNVLNSISEQIGLKKEEKRASKMPLNGLDAIAEASDPDAEAVVEDMTPAGLTRPPKYVVLDLMGVTHLDASATRGCFLQLAKMAAKKKILLCASGLTPKIEWMFRSHEVSFQTIEEEEEQKAKLLNLKARAEIDQILIFTTAQEALEYCETLVLGNITGNFRASSSFNDNDEYLLEESKEHDISTVLTNFLRINRTGEKAKILDRLLSSRFHNEKTYKAGQSVFEANKKADAWFVVLDGCVANCSATALEKMRQEQPVLSGAGPINVASTGSRMFGILSSSSGFVPTVGTVWQTGGVFGFNDFLLERTRTFQTTATVTGTRLAVFSRSDMSRLEQQDPELYSMLQQVLLRASTLDLSNVTTNDV